MAKIVEEVIVIKLSRITKEGTKVESAITEELVTTLETVAQELVGEGIVVEVTDK
jgi:hypothetical protein